MKETSEQPAEEWTKPFRF